MSPLKGIKVLEFAGLAPVPMCAKILADFGATVTRIDRSLKSNNDVLYHGKRKLAIDLKKSEGVELVKRLSKVHDVLLDPFRPGVLEKLGLGPDILMKQNPRLIYARLTGFGQSGPMAHQAGHDINYVAISGILSLLGRKHEKPTPPINLLADFAAGSLLCAFGVCMALLERTRSGKGQIIDNSMVEGCAYIGSWLTQSQKQLWFGNGRGENWLDSGSHFYDTYKTKDDKYMAVGAVEPQFYEILLDKLGLGNDNILQFDEFDKNKEILQKVFLSKTQADWTKIFEGSDACVTPVLDWQTAYKHPHNNARRSFVQKDGEIVPNPAPRLSRTPAECTVLKPVTGDYEDAINAFKEINMHNDDVRKLYDDGILMLAFRPKL